MSTASRNEARDRCLFLLMFRYGLRVSEDCRLKPDQVDTESRVLHVARLKGGVFSTQPLREDELRAIGTWPEASRADEAERHRVLCQRAAPTVAPIHRQSGSHKLICKLNMLF